MWSNLNHKYIFTQRTHSYTEAVTITPGNARWVGAWWLGYLISGTITLMSAVPLWFLPKSLPVPVHKHDISCTPEQTRFIKDSSTMKHKFRPEEPANLQQMAKGMFLFILIFILCWIALYHNSRYISMAMRDLRNVLRFVFGHTSRMRW